jgi:regulatory protein YycH of two-component signal transduction system YycFG
MYKTSHNVPVNKLQEKNMKKIFPFASLKKGVRVTSNYLQQLPTSLFLIRIRVSNARFNIVFPPPPSAYQATVSTDLNLELD